MAGGTRGGAGKVAVISSGLFGTVNGSAIANAVTTGAFTIPLMMKAGYRPHFAAGVEACASMGGQLIPPVMGAAAFIMAETLGVSYGTIAVAAAIPGVLYFVAVGVMVHFEASRRGLPVLSRAELPRLLEVLRRDFHLLAGPAVLVYFLVQGRSPLFAGFWALRGGRGDQPDPPRHAHRPRAHAQAPGGERPERAARWRWPAPPWASWSASSPPPGSG